MSQDEDAERRPARNERVLGQDLTEWSVEELERYIAELKAEIARAEEAVAARNAQRDAAEAFFKKR